MIIIKIFTIQDDIAYLVGTHLQLRHFPGHGKQRLVGEASVAGRVTATLAKAEVLELLHARDELKIRILRGGVKDSLVVLLVRIYEVSNL